ncbi:MAG TPA: sensor histidine kinase [Leptospiraceae bacterium]|nr:sensor histidine kinase [Leptospiraceae bacterium]HMY67581.1 sensor histidine kinase [Leptospiraceae bacterium]HNF13178.1 sensor histidine kinase [Leptospiraceae bacterium]HNF24748.1 sensor histidine kinase [Leptospiraceae bacterium]HNM01354.1 sensor histidine kinase [Leptospiraceae bacterium]
MLTIILAFVQCRDKLPSRIPAEKGVLDLRSWDFQENTASLDGEWEFFPGEFIDLKQKDSPQSKNFIKVNGVWNREMKGSDGYASYRLKVVLPEKRTFSLAMQVPEAGTAYSMFVNGILTASNGIVGKTKAESVPEHLPRLVSLPETGSIMEIVFHVSNFHYTEGGLWYSISLGEEKKLRSIREKRLLQTMFLCGSISIMAIYHFAVYFFRRKDRSALAFSLFCTAMDFRLLGFNEKILNNFFTGNSFLILNRIEYLAYYLAVPFFAGFQFSIFPNEFSRTALKFFWMVSSVFCGIVLLTDSSFYTQTAFYYHLYVFIFMIYTSFVMVQALRKKREGAKIFLFGLFILFAGTVNDILHSMTLIRSEYLAPQSLFAFIFIQSVMLSRRFSKGFNLAENLSLELTELNAGLERKVSDRTKELSLQKEVAEQANLIKDKFVSIVSHDLRSPLIGVSNVLDILDRKDILDSEEERSHFLKMGRESVQYSLKMIRELLSLSRIETGSVKVSRQKIRFQDLADSLKNEAVIQASLKNITIRQEILNDTPVFADLDLLTQVLRNLIGNAVKFTREGGQIILRFSTVQNWDLIEIEDNGVGMSSEQLNMIFEPGTRKVTSGTSGEAGSGMGLFICRYIMEAHKGRIEFRSAEGKGTCCSLYLPAAQSA